MKKIAIATMMLGASLWAQSMTFTKYVPVYKSVEVQREVVREMPYKECWTEEVPENSTIDDGTVGAVIGGAAGGIIGHQIGGGSGKTAATIGGAVIGTLIGKNLAERNARPGYRLVKRCRTKYKQERDYVTEYKNYARIMGRTIVKYSDRPLRKIPVTVTIEY